MIPDHRHVCGFRYESGRRLLTCVRKAGHDGHSGHQENADVAELLDLTDANEWAWITREWEATTDNPQKRRALLAEIDSNRAARHRVAP